MESLIRKRVYKHRHTTVHHKAVTHALVKIVHHLTRHHGVTHKKYRTTGGKKKRTLNYAGFY